MSDDVPSVPSLFPLLSNGFLEFPVFRMFWNDVYGCNALFVAISSATRNTRNTGNRIETA